MFAEINIDYIRTRPFKALNRSISHVFFEGRQITMRWQWLNGPIALAFSIAKRLPWQKAHSNPIYITGTGRSGTTILGEVLSYHREVGLLNEPKMLWHIAYPFEDITGSFHVPEARYRLSEVEATPDVCQTVRRLYSFYMAVTGSKRVVDKYPELIFRVPFVRAIFPEASFIFLIRNGWDTIHSIATWSRNSRLHVDDQVQDWWGRNGRKWHFITQQLVPDDPELSRYQEEITHFTRDEDKAAVEWTVTMREGLRAIQATPGVVYPVHYEDLTQHPKSVLGLLLEQCGLAVDSGLLDYAARVLRPLPARAVVELSPAIKTAFLRTMTDCGYPI